MVLLHKNIYKSRIRVSMSSDDRVISIKIIACFINAINILVGQSAMPRLVSEVFANLLVRQQDCCLILQYQHILIHF